MWDAELPRVQEKCDGLRSFDAGKLVKQILITNRSIIALTSDFKWWLGWRKFPTWTGQQAKGHPRTAQELFREEAVSRISVTVARTVTEFQSRWTIYNQKVIL